MKKLKISMNNCVEKFKNQNEVAIKLETLTNFADASFFCFGKCYN